MVKVDLSIIILSYNTKELTERCLLSLIKSLPNNKNFNAEIIVVDNGSSDGSAENIKYQILNFKNTYQKSNISFKLILNKENLGYPKGNNQALKMAKGRYILFLNSDVIVENVDFEKIISYLDVRPEIAVLTVKVILQNGNIDADSHRGFPTIWNAFCYFIGLEELFRYIPFANRIFGGYHLIHLNFAKTHEIDSASGAFFLSKKDVLEKVGGFDEEFFMYGEDIDLSFRIKKLGYKVVYYPRFAVLHLKSASGLEKEDVDTREKIRHHFFGAMKIFYRKHYEKNHPPIVNAFIYCCINFLKQIS